MGRLKQFFGIPKNQAAAVIILMHQKLGAANLRSLQGELATPAVASGANFGL